MVEGMQTVPGRGCETVTLPVIKFYAEGYSLYDVRIQVCVISKSYNIA